MRSLFLILALAAIALLLGAHPAAWAADIVPVTSGPCHFRLSGKITAGDFERFKKTVMKEDADGELVARKLPNGDTIHMVWLCLNSPHGGNFDQAVKIIEYILEWPNWAFGGLGTILERDAECRSACALLFLVGRKHEGDGYYTTQRIMHPTAKLGFHAPFNPSDAASGDKELLALSYSAGVRAVGRLLLLDEQLYPKSLLSEILSREHHEFFELGKLDELGRWDIDIMDYRAPSLDSDKQIYTLCKNMDSWREAGSADWEVPEDAVSPGLQALKTRQWKVIRLRPGLNTFRELRFGSMENDTCTVEINGRELKDWINAPSPEKWLDPTRRVFKVFFGAASVDVAYRYRPLWSVLPPATNLRSLAHRAGGRPPASGTDVLRRQ
jgi:hypothetical protein